jgi:outer membrane lipoprotein-sorting protein
MNKRWCIGLCVMMVFSLFLGGCQDRPTAEEIVAKMQEVEASIEDAHAVVEFSVQTPEKGVDLAVEMWEKSPNKFRAEVLEASADDLVGTVSVTDGQQVWMYNPSENEALVGRVGEFGVDEPLDPRRMIELMEEGIQQVLDICDVELVGEEDVDGAATYVLEFTPKEGEEVSSLPVEGTGTLWVEQERWIALQAQFDGGSLGQGRMYVRSFEFNVGVADDRFQFEVPEGVEVIQVEDTQPRHLTLDEAQAEAEFPLLVPTYLPEDTTLIDVFAAGEGFVLYYDHASTSFTVVQGLSLQMERPLSGDTSDVTVRGQTATLTTDGLENSLLTWAEDGVVIAIAGRISQDEILRVAESLQ